MHPNRTIAQPPAQAGYTDRPHRAAPSNSFYRAVLLILGLLVLPLAACSAPRHTYNLSTVALESIDEASRPAVKIQVAELTPGDHTDTNLQRAVDLLTQVNVDAPTSFQARAAQALIIDALFQADFNNPQENWLGPAVYPELYHQLSIAFDQADARINSGAADLMTVMVWARIGTSTGRTDLLCTVIQRASTDDKLRAALREDDPTRDSLYSHLLSQASPAGCPHGILYRSNATAADQIGLTAVVVLLLPVFIVFIILYEIGRVS